MTKEWPDSGHGVADLGAPGRRSVPFRQFIMKLQSKCNLSCDYCYVYEMADQTWRSRPTVMRQPVIEATCARIAEHVTDHNLRRCEVVLHGGEPLLAGTATLTAVATTLRATLPSDVKLDLKLQTNGTLLNESVLHLLAEHEIMVGVSLDGRPADHDRHRRYADGRGSHAQVAQALGLLGREPFQRLFAGLLCVVDLDAQPVATYESLLTYHPPRVDFLLPHGNWSVPPPRKHDGDVSVYGDWLIAVFDRWYGSAVQETEVRTFQEIINLIMHGRSTVETLGLSPVALIVIDTDGSLEQVDTLRSVSHGAAATGLTVFENTLDEALRHPAIVSRQLGSVALSDTCQHCDIHRICGGGYYPHRYRQGSGYLNPSVYCRDLSALIRHIHARISSDVAALRAMAL